jgi:probable HAF family extracellular repeat protein
MLRGFAITLSVVCVVLCSVGIASAVQYNLVALAPVGSGTLTLAYSCTYASGSPQAIGLSRNATADQIPVIWNSAGVGTSLLPSIGNGASAGAGNIAQFADNSGDIVGQTLVSSANRAYYLPYGGSGTILPYFYDSQVVTATGCNGLGMVVGHSITADTKYHALLWSASTGYVDLGTSGIDSYATAITADGNTIVGTTNGTPGQQGVACKWTKSGSTWTRTDLVPQSTYNQTGAYCVNSSGDIAGVLWNYPQGGFPSTTRYALYLPHGDGIVNLTSLTGHTSCIAYGINDSGVIVGTTDTTGPAFVNYTGTAAGMTDVSTLLAPGQPTGWTFQYAYGIDNHGDIAFRSKNASGVYQASMLVPVPEPCTVLLMGTGLVGLIAYAWRKRK